MNAHTEFTLSNATELVNRYLAAWNETDSTRRGQLIAQTWTEDATYVDPLARVAGHGGIDALIQGVQAQFTGLRFRLLDKVDAHNNVVRFAWELAPEGGERVVAGSDVVTLADDGRIQTVVGFLDYVPASL